MSASRLDFPKPVRLLTSDKLAVVSQQDRGAVSEFQSDPSNVSHLGDPIGRAGVPQNVLRPGREAEVDTGTTNSAAASASSPN